jgi:hypothetical protein
MIIGYFSLIKHLCLHILLSPNFLPLSHRVNLSLKYTASILYLSFKEYVVENNSWATGEDGYRHLFWGKELERLLERYTPGWMGEIRMRVVEYIRAIW